MAMRSQRGFASMDPEQRRMISCEGRRASHGHRGRRYEDEDYDDERYEEDDYEHPQDRYYDDDYDRYGPESEYDDEEDDRDYGRRHVYGEGEDYDDEGYGDDYDEDDDYDRDGDYYRGRGGRGFGSMPREEVRHIASMGGRASHGGRVNGRSGGSRSRGFDEPSRLSRRSGNGRRNPSYGGRGFAGMPREEVRRIARMGGEASHGGGRGGNGSRRGAPRRRGFGAISREEVRRIARKGGRARAANR